MNATPSTVGRYQIRALVASGASGDVFEAYDPIIDRPVAVKMLRRELAERNDVDWLERFRHEARAGGRRMHPNIVAVLDFGEQDGAPYLAMEYIDGETLDVAIRRSGAFPEARAVSIIVQVLSALEFAHGNGVIHRDIKPSNILLPDRGPIKVADFGIAHLEASDLTVEGDILGTPSYMAPEQLLGRPVDHRADLYAAGLVFAEMLTGTKQFQRGFSDVVRALQEGVVPAAPADHAGIPPAFATVIDRALARDPNERFVDAADFARAITDAAGLPPQPVEDAATAATVVRPPAVRTEAEAPVPQLSDDTLFAVQRELTAFIGPVARVAVRRLAASCLDVGDLCRELAKLIDAPAERAAFMAKVQNPKIAGASLAASATGTSNSRATPAAPLTQRLTPEMLSRIETGLAEHVGPIARILVRQQLTKSHSLVDMCRELSLAIPDETARARFLRSYGGG